ncbi:MAG: DegT/DnrJ/EryC1/StrS family aminotransferase [Desulfovibrionaceae bacterium]|nr:DegT/DnrJ/EryC1/StrS family aminotransferase [Desulfovibrionaceae bacterium]
MRDSFLVFAQPLIEQPEMDEVLDSMKKSWLGTGPKVHQFEKDFAAYKHVPHAVALNSCTAALHLACKVLNLGPGDEVITTAMTFCSSVNSIIFTGARPVLADIDPVTLQINPEAVEAAVTPRTKAILVVHYAGRPCCMDAIESIAQKYGLRIIEDCAHAIETEYRGRQAGTIGDIGCFSFYATKNIVTGEGGMAISKDPDLMRRIQTMALHGLSADAWSRFSDSGYKHYQVVELGYKYNMMDIQAAIGLHQLPRIDTYWKRRKHIWAKYMEAFRDLPITLPASIPDDIRHAYHLFTIGINRERCGISRDEALMELHRRNIGSGVHYLAIPEHPYYQKTFGWKPEDTPYATAYGRETLSLPLSPKLTEQDTDDVIAAVRDMLSL